MPRTGCGVTRMLQRASLCAFHFIRIFVVIILFEKGQYDIGPAEPGVLIILPQIKQQTPVWLLICA